MKNITDIISRPEYFCPICGEKRHITEQSTQALTLHCSSPAAQFWEFEQGSLAQILAKRHWDQSRQEVFLNLDGVLGTLK
jgi:hypothetical protein